MITYREFRPSGFDVKGLGLDDRQDWLVAPVTVNRDSNCLERSNWEVVTDDITSTDQCDRVVEPAYPSPEEIADERSPEDVYNGVE